MNLEQYRKELFEFLSIPSISAQSKHKKDIKRAAEFLQGKLSDLDFDSEVMQTKGHPVVYAENLSAGNSKPTVLIYGHYDVQSPDPLDEWTSDPFNPEIRSGNIYARGASDDKGQLYTWVAAVEELQNKFNKLPVNLKFLIEGEEEVASEHLDDFVVQNKALLNVDVCALSDTYSLSDDQPVLTYGLRGIAYYEIRVKTLAKDVHSGGYGGNVLNPVNVLSNILTNIKGEDHRINIPGFYDEVRKINKAETEKLTRFPFTENEVMDETGAKNAAGEEEYPVQVRVSGRPTFDVNGIWGGYSGEGPKTIIPASAGAKFSFRLVPHQTSEDIDKKLQKYVRDITPEGAEVELKLTSSGNPILFDINTEHFRAAENAYTKTFENKPLYFANGGSIPVTSIFKEVLEIDSIMLGYGLPDDALHSPNEKLSLTMFEKGIRTNIEFLKELSK